MLTPVFPVTYSNRSVPFRTLPRLLVVSPAASRTQGNSRQESVSTRIAGDSITMKISVRLLLRRKAPARDVFEFLSPSARPLDDYTLGGGTASQAEGECQLGLRQVARSAFTVRI